MAEIEFNRLKGQCLDRRIADANTLRQEVQAWTESRNADESDMNWRFISEDARIRLRQLYPTLYSGQFTRYILFDETTTRYADWSADSQAKFCSN